MVKCKICGIEKQSSIVEHLRHSHKMSCKEYRELFNDAQVKSSEFKLLVSKQQKEVWSNKDYAEKMCLSRQQTHRKQKE